MIEGLLGDVDRHKQRAAAELLGGKGSVSTESFNMEPDLRLQLRQVLFVEASTGPCHNKTESGIGFHQNLTASYNP